MQIDDLVVLGLRGLRFVLDVVHVEIVSESA